MRVCIVKATNKLLEAQSLATAGTLASNAIRAGYTAGEIEEKVVTDAEFAALLRTPEAIAAEAAQAQRTADIVEALPAWQAVSDAIDGAWAAGAQRVIIKRLARVVYWLAKNRVD